MKYSILLLFFLSPYFIYSQINISGVVKDDKLSPIAYANVSITKDSTIVKGSITDDKGHFDIILKENNNYLLTISFMGYETKNIEFGTSKDFGEVILNQAPEALDHIVVTGQKPFIQRQQDKLIVNVASSTLSTGNSTLEVLEKSPNIIIDQDGNITMSGRTGVRIFIDNKDTRLQGDDLTNLLRSMPSSSIEQIEIISNPSVKYEAQGNAGIINIVTKKGKFYGTNGSITLSPGYATNFKWDSSANFNHRTEKVNFFGQYSFMHRNRVEETIINRTFYNNKKISAVYSLQNDFLYPIKNHNARLGLDYEINKKTNIGVLFSSVYNVNGNDAKSFIEGFSDNRNTISIEKTKTDIKTKFLQFTSNVNANHKFKNKSLLTFNFDYAKYGTDSDQRFVSDIDNLIANQNINDILSGDVDGFLNLTGLSLDYELPLKNGSKFEIGWKNTWVKTDNDLRYTNTISNITSPNTSLSNHFIYDEEIYALYASYSISKKKWNTQLGLRAENTYVKGNQLTTTTTFDNNYVNLFPTASFNYSFNEKNTLGISVGRRIDRPSYSQLNPFRTFVNTNTYREGNPFLTPQFSWNTEVNYTLNQKYYFSFSFGYITDNLNMAIIQDGDLEAVVVKPINLDHLKSYAFTASIPIKFTNWWQSNWNLNASLNDFDGDIAGFTFNRNNPIISINGSNSFNLGKKYRLQAGVFYLLPHYASVTKIDAISSVTLGLQKSFKKTTLRFNINDIFYTQSPRGRTIFGNLDDSFTRYLDSRFATLSLTWRFGKQSVKPQRRKRSQVQDELNRARQNNN